MKLTDEEAKVLGYLVDKWEAGARERDIYRALSMTADDTRRILKHLENLGLLVAEPDDPPTPPPMRYWVTREGVGQ